MSRDTDELARLPAGHALLPDTGGVGAISDGELHFLWHFIQGSIMEHEVRESLLRAWGMCQRHTFAFLSIDAALRRGYLHGPAILYQAIMERAVAALNAYSPLHRRPITHALRATGPCYMCALRYGPESSGYPSRDVVERGRNLDEIRRFTLETEAGWHSDVCGRCAQDERRARCRRHLLDELRHGDAAVTEARAQVASICARVTRYARAFRWELRGTDTPLDRAALISAAGWCSGWNSWLRLAAESNR